MGKLRDYLARYYSGIEISGAEIVEDKPQVGDMIVNKITASRDQVYLIGISVSTAGELYRGE